MKHNKTQIQSYDQQRSRYIDIVGRKKILIKILNDIYIC